MTHILWALVNTLSGVCGVLVGFRIVKWRQARKLAKERREFVEAMAGRDGVWVTRRRP